MIFLVIVFARRFLLRSEASSLRICVAYPAKNAAGCAKLQPGEAYERQATRPFLRAGTGGNLYKAQLLGGANLADHHRRNSRSARMPEIVRLVRGDGIDVERRALRPARI